MYHPISNGLVESKGFNPLKRIQNCMDVWLEDLEQS